MHKDPLSKEIQLNEVLSRVDALEAPFVVAR